MPRDGNGNYTKPFPDVVDGTTIESAVYNGFVNDVALQLNGPVPVVAGGTGGASAAAGLFNIGGEKATQIVTDYGSHLWVPGSFRSAIAATGAPNATAAFSGICYIGEALADPPTNSNVTVEARDATSGLLYIRRKVAGAWGSWASDDVAIKKNYVVNGAMMISQENGSTAVAAGFYPVDQFATATAVTTAVFNTQQVALLTPAGSPNRIRLIVTTADAAVAAGDLVFLYTRLEGARVADLAFGYASARTVTIQFGVKAPAGTYGVSLFNAAQNRCRVETYVISAGEANTDVVKSVTFPGDTTGTWLTDTGIGIELRWALMAGISYQTPAGIWGSSNAISTSGQFNMMAGGAFELFDVSLTEGSVAPPFTVTDPASELALCARYYETIGQYQSNGYGVASVGNFGFVVWYTAAKRAIPTVVTSAVAGAGISATRNTAVITNKNFTTYRAVTATGEVYFAETATVSARL